MSSLEAFATFRRPLVQIANLSVVATAQSVLFNFNPGTRSITTVNTSPVVTTSNTNDLIVGMTVSGTGVVPGSRIVSIVRNTSITLDQNCTASATVTGTFASDGGDQIVRIRIANISANPVSLTLSDTNQTAVVPVNSTTSGTANGVYAQTTMVCTGASKISACDGIRIQANSVLELNVSIDTRLWFIGTASAAVLNVVAILQNG